MSALTALPTIGLTEPWSTVVEVAPEMAQEWIDSGAANRPIRAKRVEALARDMAAGRWLLTGESIKFDYHGRMIDGQHRCAAVVLSGAAARIMVTRGLDPHAQSVMDTNASRSAGDALHLLGARDGKDLAAALSAYVAWQTGQYRSVMSQRNVGYTHAEVIDFARRYPGMADCVAQSASVYRSCRLPRAAIAASRLALDGIDGHDSADFFSRISDMRTAGQGDPVATLLKRVSDIRLTRQRIWTSTAFFLIFRTWNAYRDGEQLTKFQFGSAGSGWALIPEPR